MLKYFLTVFISLHLFCTWSPAQIQILKLSGRTTHVSQYELRGDFVMYRKSDLCHAVLYSFDDTGVADSVKNLLRTNPAYPLKELAHSFEGDSSFSYEVTHFRKGTNPVVPNNEWRTGFTQTRLIDGKAVFADVREIIPDEKLRKLNRYDLFSVILEDGSEDVLYDPDTSEGGDPTEQEVRNYIKGEQYAMDAYHKPLHRPAGAAVGLASTFALGFYSPPVIFAYALAVGRHNPKYIPPSQEIDPELFNTPEFVNGYQKYARNKKVRQSLIWGGIGFVVGFPVFLAIFHE